MADGLRFCDQCGTAVAEGAGAPEPNDPSGASRKSVTVAFVDLGGSTAFGERVDAETARSVMGRYHALVTEAVDAHGGTVAKYIGDGVMVLFGVPEVAEDDAVRAVSFGADVQERFAPFGERVRARHGAVVTLRVGVNTGEIVVGRDDLDLYGDTLNVAARLEKACPDGGVLVGEETWRLARSDFAFEPQGEIEVHGRSGAVRPHLLRRDAELEVEVEERSTPFVGRDHELERLGRLFARTVGDRRAALASVIGPPGVGKTRLSRELQELVEGEHALVFTTTCDRDGDTTLGPVADLLRPGDVTDADVVRAGLVDRFAGDPDTDRAVEGLLAVLGASSKKVSVEEMFWAVRRLVEHLGRDRPVVLVVDDIQWASEHLLDLFEHLVAFVDDTALLLLTLSRPELRELRPAFAEAGRPVDELVLLTGLDAGATASLAAQLLGTEQLPRGLAERLPASTDGNPLFVREVVRMLVDEEVVRADGGRWVLTVEPDAIDVPPTVQSLLAARVERLPPTERALLERASVIGPEFSRGALEHLCDAAERTALPDLLRSLTRRELIEATGTYRGDDPVHRFHHVLIRDAVYRRLLKETRADLHERIGEWLAHAAANALGDHHAAIGHHLEQAFHYRTDLGDDRPEVRELGDRAAQQLLAAASVALGDDDAVTAAGLARRAVACLADDAPTRPSALALACEALLDVGDATTARPFVDELLALADLSPAFAGWAQAYDAQAITVGEPDRLADAEALATAAVDAMADLDDPAGRAKARLVRAAILARRGRIGECEAELDLALTEARAAEDTRRVVAVLGVAPLAALWGPSPVARAGGRCLDVLRLLRITASSPAVEAVALRCQAVLEALRGRVDTATSLLDRAETSIVELGLQRELADLGVARGQIHLLTGDPAAAEAPLRSARDDLVGLHAGAEASQAAALLGRALLQLDRPEEVERLVDEAEHLAGENLKAAILGRTVRAEWLLTTGRTEEARAVAERAVAIAETTDLVLDHAEAGDVLTAAGGQPATPPSELRARKGVIGAEHAAEDDPALGAPFTHGPPARAEPERSSGPHHDEAGAPAAMVATIERRVRERARDDPTDQVDVVVPQLRDVLANTAYGRLVTEVARAWEAGDDDRLAWSYGREDVAVDNRRSTVNTGTTVGDDVAALMQTTRAFFPVVEEMEVLAVRGDRHGVSRGAYRGGAAVEAFLLVGEVDAEGRVLRQVALDHDAVAEGIALLDEWYLASADVVGRQVVRHGSHLLQVLPEPETEPASERGDDLDDEHGEAWIAWYEPLSETVATAVAVQATTSSGGPADVRAWAGAVEIRDGVLRHVHLEPIEGLDVAREATRRRNGRGAFGTLAPALDGVPFLDASRWNAAVWWRLRMLAWFNDRDRDRSASLIRDDATIDDRRPLFRTELRGRDEVLHYGAQMVALGDEQVDAGTIARDPFRLVGVVDVAGDHLCLLAAFIANVTDHLDVIEVDGDGLLRRTASFEPDQLDDARATLRRWHAESPAAPLADPLDRLTFVPPALRDLMEGTPLARMADFLDAYASGDEERMAWFYGRSDLVNENRRSTLNSGRSTGADVLEVLVATRQLLPNVDASELLAVRGTRFGASRTAFGDDHGNRYDFVAVQEVDEDGRLVRQVVLDDDAVLEAVALLDEWYLASPGAVGREVLRIASRLPAVAHDPAHRDELLAFLAEDLVYDFDIKPLAAFGEVGRDDFLEVVDSLTAVAEDIHFWLVWFEPTSEHVGAGVVRRVATLADTTTAEWTFATTVEVRDGQVRHSHVTEVEDLDRVRTLAQERAAGTRHQ